MTRNALVLTLAALLVATPSVAVAAPSVASPPQIDVCFVLDTTGSMGGLIAGAKRKIWSIANEIATAKPTPQLRLSLIGYRDRGDEYVTRVFNLTDDIDAIYEHLQSFEAGGGGDTPESVNQALYEAVHKVEWNPKREVLKIIFLVGDAPPHMDYDEPRYAEIAQQAVRRDLIINTVQCGSLAETTPVWQDIARRAEGSFASLGQGGDMRAVSTPMDGRLAVLNASVGETLMAYGDTHKRNRTLAKQLAAEAAASDVAADRLAFNAKTGKVVQGGGDLLDDLKAGRVKLSELSDDELPQAMHGMSLEEKEAYLKALTAKRQALQEEIDALLVERGEYLRQERERQEEAQVKSGFDEEVARIIRKQALRKGIRYDKE